MEIKIRGLDEKLVENLDILAEKKNMSRNKFYIYILSQYALLKDEFFLTMLPDTTQFLVKNVLGEQEEKLSRMAEFVIDSHLKTVSTIQDLLGLEDG